MSETALVVEADDPLLSGDFFVELERQMRALDTYGVWDKKSRAEIIDPFILTKERKRAIPIVGDPDQATLSRIRAFFNGIAALIEKESGCMAAPLINLSHEGFGRGIITVGKLVAMDRSLRDVHRFGFLSLDKMNDEANRLLTAALALVAEHRDVAEL